MAYSTATPPYLHSQAIAGLRMWVYESTDAATVVRVDGYFTNASSLGMKAGDLVYVIDTDSSPRAASIHSINAINANGSADLGDGVAVTATDSD